MVMKRGHLLGLNPYSNGMKIEHYCAIMEINNVSLNPYSNGMKIEL